jgi:hypothetical protein
MLSRLIVQCALVAACVTHLAAHAQHDHSGDIAVSTVAGKLVVGGEHFETHGLNGYNIYEADFGDFPNPFETDDPGFQTQGGAKVSPNSILSFAGIGKLQFWNGSAWGNTVANEKVQIKDAFDGALNTWSDAGFIAGEYSFVGQAGGNGSLHEHLDMLVTPNATAGAYLIQLQLISDTDAASMPFYIAFNRGLGAEAFETSIDALVAAPVPEPETYALLLAGLALVGAATRRRAARGN